MHRRVLVLAMSVLILGCAATAVSAQQGSLTQQPPQMRDQQQSQRHADFVRGMGISRGGGMMSPGAMRGSVMMRMLFAVMDSDGDGTVELPEFQIAHERIFKAMDTNKDGRLTLEEIQGFLQGVQGGQTGVAYASVDLKCGDTTYTVSTGNNRGSCTSGGNGQYASCDDGNGSGAIAYCTSGCASSSGSGSCTAK
jgi:hypothetical protein